jgi:hypothetical protein
MGLRGFCNPYWAKIAAIAKETLFAKIALIQKKNYRI